jgi:hypothetical protein
LSRGVFTFAAKQNQNQRRQMPRACPGGVSRLSLFSWKREPPRPKAVASSLRVNRTRGVVTSVTTPRGKPVASSDFDRPLRLRRPI